LLASQVSLLEALAVTRGTLTNRYYREFIDEIVDRVNQGGKLAESFAAFPYVVESIKQMVATGEEAGRLPRVMLRLAEHYDTEVHRDLQRLAAMIEPLALIAMGGVVGVIVSAVILPMFRLSRVLG
jgi:type II secretory pathway component PulF